jgi:uncharacterized cupredoxin-like copper-binding protein
LGIRFVPLKITVVALAKGEKMKTNIMERNKIIFAFFTVLIALSMSLAACGASTPSINPDGSVNVDVTLTDFGIESTVTKFEAGKTYHFTITNKGAIPHEFVIAEPLVGGTVHGTDMEMMHEGLIVEVEEDELPPGATVIVDATFPDHVDAALEFACHTEGHYEAGMRSTITVK